MGEMFQRSKMKKLEISVTTIKKNTVLYTLKILIGHVKSS